MLHSNTTILTWKIYSMKKEKFDESFFEESDADEKEILDFTECQKPLLLKEVDFDNKDVIKEIKREDQLAFKFLCE